MEAKPIASKSAIEVADFFYSLICRYSIFESCQTDQGVYLKGIIVRTVHMAILKSEFF